MEKKKVFISTSTFAKFSDEPLRILEGSGFEHILNPTGRKVTEDELAKLAEGCVGLVAGTEKISGEVMDKLCDLKVISRCGVGMDSVDLEAAKKKGIEVVNTPDAPTLAVAELTIGLILNLLRKISSMDKELKYGVWNKKMGNLLLNKKVGIVGFGRIGRKVAEMLMQFGCAIAYHDSFVENNDMGAEKMMLNDLMKWADIISIHISESKEMIGKKEIELMKEGSWIVNTSRGGVVNEDALYDALQSKHLSGAALDVFWKEPYAGFLKELDNVILTPHIGSYAKEARINMEIESVKNLISKLEE